MGKACRGATICAANIFWRVAVLVALFSSAGSAQAVTTYFEQGILIRSGEEVQALGPTLMGDTVNEYSGGLAFTHTDTSLPGNNAIPVAVGRHIAVGTRQAHLGTGLFGDWDLEIPHLHTVATQNEPNWYGNGDKTNYNRCSQFFTPPLTSAYSGGSYKTYTANLFWDGYHMYIPGGGDQTLLSRGATNSNVPNDGTYPVVTNKHWALRCLSSLDNGAGEGFEARSPDGLHYVFNHMAVRSYPALSRPASLPRKEVWILPTQVSDQFGNWVRYTYNSADGWRVSTITSSDGRTISITYNGNGNRIQSVSDGTRTWNYAYSAGGSLQTVTQPDGSTWVMALDALELDPYTAGEPACDTDSWDGRAPISGSIKHPSGATGVFTLSFTVHGRTGVPGSSCSPFNTVSPYFASWSLTSKTLSGPGLSAETWAYAYSSPVGGFAPCNSCANTKTVTITDPKGDVAINTYGTQYGLNEGLLLSSRHGVNGASQTRATRITYAAPGAGSWPNPVGAMTAPADSMSKILTPQNLREITQQDVLFTNTVTGFDNFARPTSVTRSSGLGYSRNEATAYYDHPSLWVLGQMASLTIAGVQAESATFYASTAMLNTNSKFGKLQSTYVYNGDGTLYSVTDGLNHSTTFTNYMRGLAQNITYADGKGMSAHVNNIGTIDWVTNEVGQTWSYTYDSMGRVASETPPGGDGIAYNTKNFAFVQVGSAEYGLDSGHWRQTITEGNAVTANYFDARWRKRMTITYDAAIPSTTQRMQRFDYDPYNRPTFAAYPARSIASITTSTPGTATTYEPLGRPIQFLADSEFGGLSTTIQYLTGFQKQVTNPRGYATTTAFQVFDEPSESAITSVNAPETLNVSIIRDIYGKPKSITRSGSYGGAGVSATRSYVYDGNQLLCKTVEPEIGATIQTLDAANNVAWRAAGLGLTGTTSCETASVPSNKIVAFTYDARNRITGTGFGDGSSSIGRSYTDDGLLASVVTQGSSTVYSYNNRRLLTQESVTFPSGYGGWSVSRGYDASGHLSQMNYPDSTVISYSPNALGEATQVSGYASGVAYHPNGAVASYTLANGIVHSLTQNTRGLPAVNSDGGVMQDQYTYDGNGNIVSIADQQEGISTRSMGYDGLDRLIAANAPNVWGSASYSYDPLGNMRTSVVGSRNSTHNYDSNNRLSSINTNGAYTGYSYDSQGNVNGKGSQGFYFDQGNRLTIASGVASYYYDGEGRRALTVGSDGSTVWQLYSREGHELISQRIYNSQAVYTLHIYLGDKVIANYDYNWISGTKTFVHTDALGSPVATTNASGALISRTRYEAYGKTAGGTNPTDIGFTGHVNDAGTGLVYMQQRYYDPVAGRFLSVDPIVTDANNGKGFNLYEYVSSNPYRYRDPDGRYESCGQYIQGCTTIWINGSGSNPDRRKYEAATATGGTGNSSSSTGMQGNNERLQRLRGVLAGLVDRMKDVCANCDGATVQQLRVVASSQTAVEAGFERGTIASYNAKDNTATFYREFFAWINPIPQATGMFHEYQHSFPDNIARVKAGTAAEWAMPHDDRPWERPIINLERVFQDRFGQEILDRMR